jgi:hypothetical protein
MVFPVIQIQLVSMDFVIKIMVYINVAYLSVIILIQVKRTKTAMVYYVLLIQIALAIIVI